MIGQGGSATVFEATDLTLERNVAVKVLHPKLSSDPAFLERFRSEARAAAGLSHPNVMAVHDWGEDDRGDSTLPYLVMELLEGGSLRAMLDEGVVASPSQAIQIGLDACRGLNYAHTEGLVHRDITPANLLFGSDGRLRIADFGLAKALADSGWTESGKDLVGTARYASPEQAQGLRLAPASDVYSLGLILVEALSGSVPFSADTMLGTLTARVETDVPIPDVPEKLGEVLASMTQREAEERPSSNQAGLQLVKAAEGMPRPNALPLVGMPEIDQTVHADDPLVSNDPDVTIIDQPDQTEVAGTPIVEAASGPAVDADEPTRRWPWLLFSLIAVGAIAWFAFNQLSTAAILAPPVPEVANLSREDALVEFGDRWELDEKFDRDADIAAGNVVRTEPVAGELLGEGEVLSYWVSLGRPLVRVPVDELLGRSQEQALLRLEDVGLSVGSVERVNSEDVGAGNVLSVESAAPELPLGDPVDLVVSLGPQARQIPEFTAATNADEYIATLETAGLGVNRLDEFNDANVPEGQFVSVDPPPGTSIDRGGAVTIIVSKGPTPVPIPPTSGRSLGEVLDSLQAVGLLAGDLLGPDDEPGNARCDVIGTDPPQGTELQPGETVTVFLSDCGDG